MWKPSAEIEVLKKRARLLQSIRAFFAQRDVLEVNTPIISSAANTDPHLDSIAVHSAFSTSAENRSCVSSTSSVPGGRPHYLLTSPELPIKRLLAAGMGDCYQLGQVFRDGEVGRYHNPEFTMLEWYRIGFSMFDLIEEVEQLIQSQAHQILSIKRYSYAQLFVEYLGMDVLTASVEAINQRLYADTLWEATQGMLDKDAALDLLFSQAIAPQFSADQVTSVYHYPASQASLAQINADDPRTAERFEVYWGEVELANGFHELANVDEQRQRFEEDNQQRQAANKATLPMDEYFLQALEQGLPDCSGVALGVDRLLMKVLDKSHIKDVLSFDWERI